MNPLLFGLVALVILSVSLTFRERKLLLSLTPEEQGKIVSNIKRRSFGDFAPFLILFFALIVYEKLFPTEKLWGVLTFAAWFVIWTVIRARGAARDMESVGIPKSYQAIRVQASVIRAGSVALFITWGLLKSNGVIR
ncbi:hypothetical protein SAMN05444156_2216 [Verrucomicrobium sp. GAS474]|uniref:hypothetical protein n=1 Tax=Verrucomicrobium sp. GAS474 TaxID=1882831 RepID=UPI00087B191C|nr:hypothetical protein [Verrucomicrobium sp. GAS474]SDU14313.1 hypothetical protein SAMN05444156_2216 [Verrucomicrobium sp. GAS474]